MNPSFFLKVSLTAKFLVCTNKIKYLFQKATVTGRLVLCTEKWILYTVIFFTVYRQISQSETTKRKNICQRGQKSSKVFLVVRDKANFMHVIYKPEALLFVGRGYVAQYTIPGFFEDAERFEIEFGLR